MSRLHISLLVTCYSVTMESVLFTLAAQKGKMEAYLLRGKCSVAFKKIQDNHMVYFMVNPGT